MALAASSLLAMLSIFGRGQLLIEKKGGLGFDIAYLASLSAIAGRAQGAVGARHRQGKLAVG